jgi:hypothetical protein
MLTPDGRTWSDAGVKTEKPCCQINDLWKCPSVCGDGCADTFDLYPGIFTDNPTRCNYSEGPPTSERRRSTQLSGRSVPLDVAAPRDGFVVKRDGSKQPAEQLVSRDDPTNKYWKGKWDSEGVQPWKNQEEGWKGTSGGDDGSSKSADDGDDEDDTCTDAICSAQHERLHNPSEGKQAMKEIPFALHMTNNG